MTEPGDTVFVLGEYQMGGIGIEDDEALVKVGKGFAVVPRASIVGTRPQPFTEHLAVVDRDDLRTICEFVGKPGMYSEPRLAEALARLRTAAGGEDAREPTGWPPQPGDVWQDADDGHVWFATRRSDALWLTPASDGWIMRIGTDQVPEGLVLRWRNDA